jgi:hypothetical protein
LVIYGHAKPFDSDAGFQKRGGTVCTCLVIIGFAAPQFVPARSAPLITHYSIWQDVATAQNFYYSLFSVPGSFTLFSRVLDGLFLFRRKCVQ